MGYEIVSVNLSNKNLIDDFLKNAGSSLIKFRYFKSRPIEIIKNHLTTLIALKEKKPVGYAHLDKESETTWLGIAVIESEKGKGLGIMLMARPVMEEKKKHLKKMTLAVDTDNANAIYHYKKYGFTLLEQEKNKFYFEAEVK